MPVRLAALFCCICASLFAQQGGIPPARMRDMLTVATQADPLAIGLVGWWKFDEGVGTLARDSSGYGNNGTLYNNPTWTRGVNGSALLFNGANYVTNASDGTYSASATSISSSAWICPSNVTENAACAVSGNRNNPDNNTGGFFIAIDNRSGKVNNIWATVATATGYKQVGNGGNSIASNTWMHVCITYTHPGALILYTNGVLSSSSVSTSNYKPVNEIFGIGVFGASISDPKWNGFIDDVRIYTRAINATEVLQLYQRRGQ